MHTLEPTEGPRGVQSGPRRPQTGPQNPSARPKTAFWAPGPKFLYVLFRKKKIIKSVPGGSWILQIQFLPSDTPFLRKMAKNPKWPKKAQSPHKKWMFFVFKVFILKMTAILPWFWICRSFFFEFFSHNFSGCFQMVFLHKKVSLTTLAPSGTPRGATHGLSQAPGGLQNCLFFGQIWPI